MRTVPTSSVAAAEAPLDGLPERVQEALGELAGAAKKGLLALSVGVGLGVLHEFMEAEVARARPNLPWALASTLLASALIRHRRPGASTSPPRTGGFGEPTRRRCARWSRRGTSTFMTPYLARGTGAGGHRRLTAKL